LQREQPIFVVKVKAYPGEPATVLANEASNFLADKAISGPKVGKEWCQQMIEK